MSLLMDALKKAEREKKRAASMKGSRDFSDRSTSEAVIPPAETALDQANSSHTEDWEETIPDLSDKDSTEQILAEEKDENWIFDTGELELEPLVENPEVAEKSDSGEGFDLNDSAADVAGTSLDGDETVAEPMPTEAEMGSFPEDSDLTIKSGGSNSDFDHDATLPSERAIQSSLKDYFEASQSITLDQNSDGGGLAPDVTEHSVTSTSPLDISATHVTAHTIFTAGRARQASTGLAKYALLGAALLVVGLGSVALYYSFVTPATIDMPGITPTVATMLKADERSQMVDVEVQSIGMDLPFEPGKVLTTDPEDPVLAGVVEEVSSERILAETNLVKESSTRAIAKSQQALPIVTAQQTLASKSLKQGRTAGREGVTNNSFGFKDKVRTDEPEKAILLKHKQYQIAVNDPIEVMSAEDFSEGLKMPKSAIKITRGRTHRAGNSDLTKAYQAYQTGRYQDAKIIYRKVLNNRSDSRDARLGIAAIAVLEGNYEKAYRHYQYLRQQNPRDQVVNAALFNLQGNANGSVSESQLKLLLDQNPDSPQVHFSLGSFYAGQSRWSEAQQAFFDAYSMDKNNADYAYNLAVSLDQIGQVKSSLSYYRKALRLAERTPISFNTSRVLARIQKLSGIVKISD